MYHIFLSRLHDYHIHTGIPSFAAGHYKLTMESVEYVEGILPIKENILGNAKAEYG